MESLLKNKMVNTEYRKLEGIKDAKVFEFLNDAVTLCNPESIFVNTGSAEDLDYIRNKALELGEEIALATPGHSIHFDNSKDQARDKKNTKILIPEGKELEGINALPRKSGLEEVRGFLKDSMKSREMIVGFYSLGPANSAFSLPAVQITDSFYVAHSESILYRPGYEKFAKGEELPYFFKFIHSAGKIDERMTSIDLDKRRVYIDLEGDTVYSSNTQYGGNTIGLKKLAMRLAINHASREGWLCEHMLIMGIKGPKDRTTYLTGAFPSLCGKTSTAMMEDETIVGDDIAYIREIDGEAKGVNVEKGIFGIIQGINSKDDPLIWNALHSQSEIIVSNILYTPEKIPCWIGKEGDIPEKGMNHSGEWHPGKKDEDGKEIPPSHPNARFTIALSSLDNLDPDAEVAGGLKISGFVYGGRDSDTSCPVEEAFDWTHGIIIKGAILESETTAATLGKAGVRVLNPMSNLDFLSVPLGKYLEMNLDFANNLKETPRIFGVNYFLKDKDDNFLNEREDKRVWYKWIEKRVHGEVKALLIPTGLIPVYEDLKSIFKNLLNKDYTQQQYEQQFSLRIPENLKKIERVEQHYRSFKGIPEVFFETLQAQRKRLEDAKKEFNSDCIAPSNFTCI